MKINELFSISESRGGELYHGTDINKLNRILQDNVLVANAPIHSDLIPKKFKQYKKTVSLSRNSKVAVDFARLSSGSYDTTEAPVVICLDQASLHRDLGRRMRPYNDLESLDKEFDLDNYTKASSRARGTTEAEEVVFGNINNINSYITKIIIHYSVTPSKDAVANLQKYKKVLNDPRVIITDFLDRNMTGRDFMKLSFKSV